MATLNRSGVLLKSNFEVSSKIEAFYTGGKVQFSSVDDHIFCTCNDKIQVVHVKTGKTVQTLQEEGDVVSCFALSPDDKFCVTASKSLLLRQWDWMTGRQIKTWKDRFHRLLPYAVMGANALLCGLLCLTLPETANQPTLETINGHTLALKAGDEAQEDNNQNVGDEEKAALVPESCHVSSV